MLLRQSPKTTTHLLLRHLSTTSFNLPFSLFTHHHHHRHFSTEPTTNNTKGDDNWNDAWETAWLPDDNNAISTPNTSPHSRAPWELDSIDNSPPLPPDIDAETKAFVADMNDNWEERRRGKGKGKEKERKGEEDHKSDNNGGGGNGGLYSLENVMKDYRLKKQRVHAGLWVKEIEKLEEAKLGVDGHGDDIDKLLDSCSEIFDSSGNDINNQKIPSTSEFKNKPDGWETTSKSEDGNVWEMSQREEDILLQEFERRMAFCKFQVASFIKSHIFSRRRPIDGWKYMIEVIGPNAKQGKGSVSRLPSLADPATRSFTEDRPPATGGGRLTSPKRR